MQCLSCSLWFSNPDWCPGSGAGFYHHPPVALIFKKIGIEMPDLVNQIGVAVHKNCRGTVRLSLAKPECAAAFCAFCEIRGFSPFQGFSDISDIWVIGRHMENQVTDQQKNVSRC